MLAMSKVHKAEVLLSESNYENLKIFFSKKGTMSSSTHFGSFDDGSSVKLEIEPSGVLNCVQVVATLYKEGEELDRNIYEFKKISEFNGIFSFDLKFPTQKYIFRIKKDWPVSKDSLMNRFNITKWNSFKVEYIENLIQYNDWSNEIDMFEVAFASLIGFVFSMDCSKKDELTEYLFNKLDYYGYSLDEIEFVEEMQSKEDLINNLIYFLLKQLNKTGSINSTKGAEVLAYQYLSKFIVECLS